MPELPEVEVLARHLEPLLCGRRIRDVEVRRVRVVAPTSPRQLQRALKGAQFTGLSRRGKYLVFTLRPSRNQPPITLLGHLGMTGRMYLLPAEASLAKHAAVVLGLGRDNFVFEDTRYFGRLTLDTSPLARLGPEPFDGGFSADSLARALQGSKQAIKVKLLDQRVVAGVGNIYASEALFRAGISPQRPAGRLNGVQVMRLWQAIRETLGEAIAWGSTVPLSYAGTDRGDGLFYFGKAVEASGNYEERLRIYDRAGQPCGTCGSRIRRLVQSARSTFYCPRCQRAGAS